MLINRKIDITFLQETHSTPEAVRKWKKEWKGKSICHLETLPKPRELAILFKEDFDIDILQSQKDKEGQILQTRIQRRRVEEGAGGGGGSKGSGLLPFFDTVQIVSSNS